MALRFKNMYMLNMLGSGRQSVHTHFFNQTFLQFVCASDCFAWILIDARLLFCGLIIIETYSYPNTLQHCMHTGVVQSILMLFECYFPCKNH